MPLHTAVDCITAVFFCLLSHKMEQPYAERTSAMPQRHPAPPRTQHRPSRRSTSYHTLTEPTSLSEQLPRLLRAWGTGLLILVTFGILSSALAAGILLSLPNPAAALPSVAIALLLLSSLLASAAAGRISRERQLLCGICMGVLVLLLLYACSVPMPAQHGYFSATPAWLLRGAVMLFCCFGSYLGARLPQKRSKKRH